MEDDRKPESPYLHETHADLSEFYKNETYIRLRENPAYVIDEENDCVTKADDPRFFAKIFDDQAGRLGVIYVAETPAPENRFYVFDTCDEEQ